MSIAVGSPLVNYRLAVQGKDRLLAQFQKTPAYARSVEYYRENIGKVRTVEDFLKDRRLLQVALSAFQLEDEINAKGKLRKLLSEDPADRKSLAQGLIDPRFRQFAQAFASLRSDGGRQIRDASSVAAVLDRHLTNEFEKFLGDSDPAVREAFYFKRTIEDTIDLKNVRELLDKFSKSPGMTEAAKFYRDTVGSVKLVADLLQNDRMLAIALSAYKLDGLLTEKPTVERLLTENPDAAGSLARSDPRYMSFAKAFFSLRHDKGSQMHATAAVDGLIAAYQRNEFEQSLALGDKPARAAFTAQFESSPTAGQGSVAYYRETVASITSVEALLAEDRMLDVVLTAFDLDGLSGDKAAVRRLLSEDPAAAGSLAQGDPRLRQFAVELAPLRTDGGQRFQGAAFVDAVVAAFNEKRYGNSLDLAQADAYYRTNIAGVGTPDDLLADGQLLHTALVAFDLGDLLADKPAVRLLLTEDPAAPGSLAQSDPRYLAFAQAFQPLQSDGGQQIRSETGIDAVLTAFAGRLFRAAPSTAQSAAYYRDNIASVATVDDLLNDGRLLDVALAAFDLGGLINDKPSVRRLLTELTVFPSSLARTDPRMMRFAEAFGTLKSDSGAKIKSQADVDAVTGAFANRLANDAATTGALVSYYRDNIGKVAGTADLLADDQLLTVALGAFKLSSLLADRPKVQLLLTEDPLAAGALAGTDPRFAAFAKAFQTLRSDGGAQIRGEADVEAVTAAFRTNEADRLFALTQPQGRAAAFTAEQQAKIAALFADFRSSPSQVQTVGHFRAGIARVTSAETLLADKRLLGVALSAFQLEGLAETPAVVRALLTQDPSGPDALAQSDPRYMQLARSFAPLRSRSAVRDPGAIEAMIAAYQANEFQKSLDPNVRQAATATGILSPFQILADRTLSKVARETLRLPAQTAALDTAQQVAAMKRAGLDPAKLQDPVQLEKFVSRYLVKAGADQAASRPSLATALLQSGNASGSSILGLIPGLGRVNLLA